jgi:hypothetical protein
MPTRARRRGRGQALVEFALVAPTFFILVFSFMFLSMARYDWLAMEAASRASTDAAVNSAGPASARFAADPVLVFPTAGIKIGSTAYTDLTRKTAPVGLFAQDKSCNRFALNATTANLGWDWGCRYNADSGKAIGGSGSGFVKPDVGGLGINGPLSVATATAAAKIKDLVLGGVPSDVRITVCYAVADARGVPACVYSATAGSDGKATILGMVAAGNSAAPAYIITRIQSSRPIVPMLGFSVSLDVTNVRAMDLFLPSSCPAGQATC